MEHLKFLAWKEALAFQGIEFLMEEYMPLIGFNSKTILKKLSYSKGVVIPDEVLFLRKERYLELQMKVVPPIKEIVAYVLKLTQEKSTHGIKLGLASSAPKHEILINLKIVGLELVFDCVISGHDDLDSFVDEEGTNKPKLYIYLEVSRALNVAPAYCLVFEDTASGVEAASKAGMAVFALLNRFTRNHDFSKANKVLHSHSELSYNSVGL